MVSINVNAIAIHDSLELSLFDQRWRYRRSPLTSNKWSNSFSRISRVTYGNHEKDCHASASGCLIPYKLILHNIIFITLIVFINNQQILGYVHILQHLY